MKKYINMLSLIGMMGILFTGCKKDENKVELLSAKEPVASISYTGSKLLKKEDKAKTAFTLSWTNPDYRFTTGLSSHDVTYTIQFDSVGKGFVSPKLQEVIVSKDLSKKYTVDEFNKLIGKMEPQFGQPLSLDVRVIASLNGSAKQVSNVLQITDVFPFEDFAIDPPKAGGGTGELYITGNATPEDWTNNPSTAQKFTKINDGLFQITIAFASGKQYKFLSSPGNWQPQYGASDASQGKMEGNLGANMGGGSDPEVINTPDDPGTYKITVNFYTGKYKLEKQ